eukprot:12390122-Heterocapsa_arctica.AAC.1
MLLDIMKGVRDKAPARKKEDKQENAENCQKCFHGPKTGVHGAHTLVAREDGGWKCETCNKYTTMHMGWRRLVRSPCTTRAKASRAKWKTSFHRRSWGRM